MTEKIKLSTAMRSGAEGIRPEFWWFKIGGEVMLMGEKILDATAACDLGCAWIGAIKAGVETAPRYYQIEPYKGTFLDWMEEYWPELNSTVINPDNQEPGTLLMAILWLNDQWTREQVIEWLEGLGY